MSEQQDGEHFSSDESSETPAPGNDAAPERSFEDLTLAEAVGMLRSAPRTTLRALAAVARTPVDVPEHQAAAPSVFAPPQYMSPPLPGTPTAVLPDATRMSVQPRVDVTASEFPARRSLILLQYVLRVVALALAIWGGVVMFQSPIRSEATGLDVGAPYLLAGFLLWLLGDVIPALIERRPRPHRQPMAHRREVTLVRSRTRLIAAVAGLIGSVLTWELNGGNMFTLPGVIAWFGSIILWAWALAPQGWTPLTGVQTAWRWLRGTRLRVTWTVIALIAIMAVGGYFRFVNLDGTPPEMTSDHVEKLLDVERVLHGETNVFFANNHGREAIQFYALVLMSYVPGMDFNFHLLKLLTVLEGLITLPVLWWMGKQIIGEDEPQLGNAVGLLIAALVAVSYWHEMLSRLGLRIVLTPLFTALVIGFLARGLRNNRRSDFLYAGLALGFGVYAYQVIRMLPVAVVVSFLFVFIFGVRTLAERRHLLVNFIALVIVAFVVFVPLFRYSIEYSEDFWRRTSGRLFGDDLTETTDANGNLVERVPTIQEQIDAFDKNVPVLLDNFRNALLMYDWKGDIAWINNAPTHPAFDPISGGLLIVGVAAWLMRMIRRRDAFDWSLLPLILIMMLPSALSIAYPIENPSATRMSGTLPGVYLLAALPLALVALELPRLVRWMGSWRAAILSGALVLLSLNVNWQTYFEDYRSAYIANSLPYTAGASVMRPFASTNGYGNVFILAYPYWWDHRALAIDAGNIDWPNTITRLEDVPTYLEQAAERPGDLRLDVTKDMLFFYSPDDTQSQEWLTQNFPKGAWENVPTYQPGHSFNIFYVPALGAQGFVQFLERFGLQSPVG